MLLIHGLGRSLDDWHATMTDLARDHEVIALDLLGSGHTDKPDVPYTLPGLARFILAFMDALDLPHATLVGNSMGAAIALHVAIRAPGRVTRLVLVSPIGFGREVTWALRLTSLPGLGELIASPGPLGARLTLSSILHDQRLVTPARLEQELRLAQIPGASRQFLRLTRMMIGPLGVRQAWRTAMLEGLRTIRMPVLAVWGREDRILPVAHLEALTQALPQAQTVVLPTCGHCPQFEQPEVLNAALRDFLAETAGGPVRSGA